MPVRDHLRHLAAVRGRPAGHDAVLDALGGDGAMTEPVARLATGNAQKVGLAQAFGCAPELVVLDEPWIALDGAAAAALDRLLLAAVDGGAAVLVADHTERMAGLDGVGVREPVAGRLVEVAAPAADVGTAMIELRFPGPPADALRELPPVVDAWTEAGQLTVRVRTDRSDALLSAALSTGCQVLAMWQER